MSKAYDRVQWSFMENIMRALGFYEAWSSLIMKCVLSVTYSIILNGAQGENFHPSRGLRQGDPLSPFVLDMRRGIS